MRVDDVLERIYARAGLRILSLALLVTYAYGLIFGWALTGMYSYITAMSVGGFLILCAQWSGELAILMALAWYFVRRVTGPLRAHVEGGEATAECGRAWTAARELPRKVGKTFVIGLVSLAPLHALSVWWVAPEPLPLFLGYCLGYVVVFLPVVVFALFALQIALRPIMRTLPYDPDLPLSNGGISVSARLLLAYPALMFGPLVIGMAMALRRGELFARTDDLMVHLVGGLALVLGWILPLVLLLGVATLAPLGDLLRAAKALRVGDLSVRVPEIAADEHGVLARAFNDAFQGLEDRVRIAGENERLQSELADVRARVIVASDDERVRLEREIADGASQHFISFGLRVRTLRERTEDPQMQWALAGLEESVDKALEMLREVTAGVHPPVLETDGLLPAIEHLAARAPIATHVAAVDRRFDRSVEEAVYYVTSEALSNAVKHGHASSVDISIATEGNELRVTVEDNGVGGVSRGPGLARLEDRIASLGGYLKFQSLTPRGSQICAMIPL